MVARRGSSLDNGFVAMDHFEFIGSESCQFTPQETTNDQLLRQCLFQQSHQTVRFYLKLSKGQEILERNRGASNTISSKVTVVIT